MRIHPRFNIPDFYKDLWLPDKIMVRSRGYEDSPPGQYPRLLQRFMDTDKIMVRSRGYDH